MPYTWDALSGPLLAQFLSLGLFSLGLSLLELFCTLSLLDVHTLDDVLSQLGMLVIDLSIHF